MDAAVKEEPGIPEAAQRKAEVPAAVIDLDSSDDSDSDSDSDVEDEESGDESREASGNGGGKRGRASDGEGPRKKRRFEDAAVVLPLGFLDPLPPEDLSLEPEQGMLGVVMPLAAPRCRQFWKAGDYEGDAADTGGPESTSVGMDRVRVHPKFLHSNATSHKWALGAFAELLDNSLDEVCNGATFVNIDMLQNKKDNSRMLLIEDNGGGMDPDRVRQCMSLGYSAKSKSANTIGQYGNGFKTSTMRLGADVIVFSRCRGKEGKRSTQTIGLLSYTFLRSTRKEDIVVPMIDYVKEGMTWKSMIRTSPTDWDRNLETIVQWSPCYSEADLLHQFNSIKDQGTRIIIYNLWEDDQGELELDFCIDPHDIQIRGVNRDEKKIQMARKLPNSRHFLTYRHSLRSYASILYLRLPLGFRIILRGKDIQHHNIVDDMMYTQEITYRPQQTVDVVPSANMLAVVTIGFVKDAKEHIDVQGFNVYHKNRLIKPFWRIWNSAGSDGRGVIGVLEANFVEPAHDKQGFERTTVLQRLESRLVQMQKTYWSANCQYIGYAPRRHRKQAKETSPEALSQLSSDKNQSSRESNSKRANGHASDIMENGKVTSKSEKKFQYVQSTSEEDSDEDPRSTPLNSLQKGTEEHPRSIPLNSLQKGTFHVSGSVEKEQSHSAPSLPRNLKQLEEENHMLKEKNKGLEARIQELEKRVEEANKEQEALIDIFSEERIRRDKAEETLRKKLKAASATIQDLLEKVHSSNSAKPEC